MAINKFFPSEGMGTFKQRCTSHLIVNFYKVSHQHRQKNLSMAEENAKENVLKLQIQIEAY